MVEKEYSEELTEVTEECIVSMTCDICNNPIKQGSYYFQGSFQGKDKSSKDDSYAEKGEFECCSGECLSKKIEELEYFFDNFGHLQPNVEVRYTEYAKIY